MPTLNWIGKDAVINHHHDVPFKTLDKQYTFVNGETIVDDGRDAARHVYTENKIIHGDNLEALKALLPEYEGRIKCIYIDPPYNTGNENWVYNDNVNSPRIRKWLGQVVGKEAEDLTRHDKWLCMMYPRLKLLHQLLSDDGAIFISIDDNEQANLKLICDEIFGANNNVANMIVIRSEGGGMAKQMVKGHDHLFIYSKNINKFKPLGKVKDIRGKIIEKNNEKYWIQEDWLRKEFGKYGNCHYEEIEQYKGIEKKKEIDHGIQNGDYILVPKSNGMNIVGKLRKLNEDVSKFYSVIKHLSANGIKDLAEYGIDFDYPKPVSLIEEMILGITILTKNDGDIILDSFAGSGTTAHAVLNLNKQDGGNRKFILVEMEDYAETITAERVRRVISGYGRDAVHTMNNGRDAVHTMNNGRDAARHVSTEGTGGAFTYYELGEPIMNGDYLNENQPIEKIREYIWYSETHTAYNGATTENPYYLGNHNNAGYYFYYEKNTTTTLDKAFLNTISQPADQYIIYADNCLLSDEFMRLNNIVFKKIPRDIRKF